MWCCFDVVVIVFFGGGGFRGEVVCSGGSVLDFEREKIGRWAGGKFVRGGECYFDS